QNWKSFSYDERIGFSQLFFLKMDSITSPVFLQLFLNAFQSEKDRRVWYYLIDCFHLLYSMIFFNTALTEKLVKAVRKEAEKILEKVGSVELKTD
ncbi:hypothetical protein PFISCL1PPCAC_14962, partial [Pristionchus fissidentatus]